MSYDLEIGTHREPTRGQVEAWAAERELNVEADDGGFVVSRVLKRGDGHLFRVDGPVAAESDDFGDAVAAACLAPRWMTRLEVPYGTPKTAVTLARALAKRLAEANEGAAFDPQADRLIAPSGSTRRVEPRRAREETSVVELEWCVTADRWPQAPETLIRLIGRRCPEALPAATDGGSRRNTGSNPSGPRRSSTSSSTRRRATASGSAGARASVAHGRHPRRSGATGLRPASQVSAGSGSASTVPCSARIRKWRTTVVELFVSVASELGALFAAAQVERGWIVDTRNRLWADRRTDSGESFIGRGGFWHGLPRVPMWLSWFGEPYMDLVGPHLTPRAFADVAKPSGLRRLLARSAETITARIERRANGLFVQLGDEPRPAARLGGWPIPSDLVASSMAPGGEAERIPPLGPR